MLSCLVLALLVAQIACQVLPYPEVTIEQGTVRGKYETSASGRKYAAFLGIPYAQPPVNKQRFKEPKSPKPWVGTLTATEEGPACLQYSHLDYQISGDEDCLHVNVFTPFVPVNVQTSRRLDVIVSIHGGAFMFLKGSAFGPRYLMDRDVVYVNFNYRLGPLGFLSTEDAIIPGNNGMKDQSAALRWVQRNIAAFGGNPASVTIIGLSAGGASVHYHYLSPLSQGLFARGISFSGTALCPWTLMEDARQKAFQLGDSLGCNTLDSTMLLNCLRNRPANQIISHSKQFFGWMYNPYSPFALTVEPAGTKFPFLSQDPYEILKSGMYQQLPWITTVTSEEGLYPGAEIVGTYENLREVDNRWGELLPLILDFNSTVEPELKQDVCNDIKTQYLNNYNPSQDTPNFIKMISDRMFISCAVEAAKVQAQTSASPVYFYHYSYRGSKSLSNLFTHDNSNHGTSHADDVLCFLDNPFLEAETPAEKEMTQKLLDFVISFARDGIPQFTPSFVFPTVQQGLPALNYVSIKSPSEFIPEQSTTLGNPDFWFSLPLYESVNIGRLEASTLPAKGEL